MVSTNTVWKLWSLSYWCCRTNFFNSNNSFNRYLGMSLLVYTFYFTKNIKAMILSKVFLSNCLPSNLMKFWKSFVILYSYCSWETWFLIQTCHYADWTDCLYNFVFSVCLDVQVNLTFCSFKLSFQSHLPWFMQFKHTFTNGYISLTCS